MLKIIVAGCSVLLASGVIAATTATAAGTAAAGNAAAVAVQPADTKAESGTEKKVCRNIGASHTRRTHRVCLSQKEWAQVDRDAQ